MARNKQGRNNNNATHKNDQTLPATGDTTNNEDELAEPSDNDDTAKALKEIPAAISLPNVVAGSYGSLHATHPDVILEQHPVRTPKVAQRNFTQYLPTRKK